MLSHGREMSTPSAFLMGYGTLCFLGRIACYGYYYCRYSVVYICLCVYMRVSVGQKHELY